MVIIHLLYYYSPINPLANKKGKEKYYNFRCTMYCSIGYSPFVLVALLDIYIFEYVSDKIISMIIKI